MECVVWEMVWLCSLWHAFNQTSFALWYLILPHWETLKLSPALWGNHVTLTLSTASLLLSHLPSISYRSYLTRTELVARCCPWPRPPPRAPPHWPRQPVACQTSRRSLIQGHPIARLAPSHGVEQHDRVRATGRLQPLPQIRRSSTRRRPTLVGSV